MKKCFSIIFLSLSICIILCQSTWFIPVQDELLSSINLSVSMFNPEKTIVMLSSVISDDDWDARDEFNRQVPGNTSKQNLQNIFLSCVDSFLLNPDIHTIAGILAILKQKLGVGDKFFSNNVKYLCQLIMGVLIQVKRAVITNAFSKVAVIAICILHLLSYLFYLPKAKVAPLVLRC